MAIFCYSYWMKILLTGVLFFIASCKFSYSPYSVELPKFNQNESSLARIRLEESQTGPEFKIAFLSDTHNYYDELSELVKVINQRGPYAFVIVAGDITNEGLREEFLKSKEILNGLKYPYLVVVGNHDLLANGKEIYSKLFGPRDFTFTYRDITFVLMNNNNWEVGGTVPDLRFLEDSLSAATTPNRVIVQHVSPDDRERFSQSEIERYETIVTTLGVNYIFNGHNHNPGEGIFAGAKHITIGSPSKKFFFELISSPGGLTHQKVPF